MRGEIPARAALPLPALYVSFPTWRVFQQGSVIGAGGVFTKGRQSIILMCENQLKDGRMVEKSGKRIMYDIRKMSETVKMLGRPLANDEIKK
ncbi:hypothetical protein [Enterocloster lavalensis]|uniref:hypothetical protein n=1 Tax=Enterocloster lavalensis TaxID=460384 RepID=UPI002665BA80|nr:hypothetical protein [Enterocloster lavalensis]